MFELIRKYSKILMIPLYGLIILGFVFGGVQGYRGAQSNADAVAKVGSQSVSQAEWDAAHNDQIKRIRAETPNADPKLMELGLAFAKAISSVTLLAATEGFTTNTKGLTVASVIGAKSARL